MTGGVGHTLSEAIEEINAWIAAIDSKSESPMM